MKRRAVGNPLGLAVLAGLLEEPMHPYEMARRFVEYGKEKDFKYTRSSLYMVVGQLEKAGFIAEQETLRDTARPERTVYAITPTGRLELFDWMRELVAEPADEYPLFGAALSLLMVLPPDEARDLLTQRLTALTNTVGVMRAGLSRALDQGLPWWHLIEDDYRLTRLEAERSFVTQLIESLAGDDYQQAWTEFFGGSRERPDHRCRHRRHCDSHGPATGGHRRHGVRGVLEDGRRRGRRVDPGAQRTQRVAADQR
ncbi:PadR family transcriptional regulator [Kibdelosporangium lantanae]